MGGITPALGPILQFGAGLYQDSVAEKQAKKQNRLEEAQYRQAASLQKEQIRMQSQMAEQDRRAALKRAVAKQRASFGGAGIGSGGGSSEAVLLGLFEESENERRQREQMDHLKETALDQTGSNKYQLNLLQQAQLQEKNRLSQISGLILKWGKDE